MKTTHVQLKATEAMTIHAFGFTDRGVGFPVFCNGLNITAPPKRRTSR